MAQMEAQGHIGLCRVENATQPDRCVPVAGTGGGEQASSWFGATHWSVVLAAGHADPARRQAALEILCRTYWEPLYVCLRGLGQDAEDAKDLTQAFLAHLLAADPFAKLSPDQGKFRSFLLKALKNFVADEHARATAAKRGGGQKPLPLDEESAERHYLQAVGVTRTPEAIFDRHWALTVLDRAFQALQQEFMAAGKAAQFAELSAFLSTEGGSEEYGAAAEKLELTVGAGAVAVHRMRRRYRECIRCEIAQTVHSAREVDEEMRYLLEVLSQ
jgi:RNA polymerase sigma-70 factor (ECF subfamily)